MKTAVRTLLTLSVFAAAALAFDSEYKTRFITSATLTIHVKDGQFITIRNFTQDHLVVGQGRGVIDAGLPAPSPTPTPTATATPTPTLSTTAGPGVALSTGGKLTDTAILFGDTNPTGTITFNLLDPSLVLVYTDTVTVSGNGTYSTASGNNPGGFLPTVTGTYTWSALYSGDSNNSAAIDNGQNETAIVTATPTPPPTPTPTPTPIKAGVLTAALLEPSKEFIKPIIIAGPATLTIDPVPGATLSITYRKSLQPIQPTPTPTPGTVIVINGATATPTPSSVLSVGTSTTTSHSTVATESLMSDEDDGFSSSPTPTSTATPTRTPSSQLPTPTPTPTATPSITPTPSPTPTA